MSVRRFVGINSREAMRQVRAALGDDALILSNRRVEEGVEILALAEDEHGRMTQPSAGSPAPPRPASPMAPPATGGMDFTAFSERLLGEMQEMREMLVQRERADAATTGDPLDRLRQRLWSAGIGPRLTSELLEHLPRELRHADDEASRQAWLERQLVARLQIPGDESALFERRGIIALVGPTGVGKTTTTAKLAARYVMRHGREGVALVTTDSYRVGAHEQLRIYAGLLGVDVYAHDAEAPLDGLLARLADKHLVIIDTVGMSQRDQRLVGQIAQLSSGDRAVRLMLLLNAASHGDTLEDVIVTYRQAARSAGNRLDDCIVTKRDEAVRLGPLLDGVVRHGLCLHYVSHGQQVPEDLGVADAERLVAETFASSGDSPFTPELVHLDKRPERARRMSAMSRNLLGQGRTLGAALRTLRERQAGFALLEESWALASLPRARQQQALAGLFQRDTELALQEGHAAGGLIMLWGANRIGGCDWPLPVQAVNAHGEPLASSWQYHELPAGGSERLDWASSTLGACAHVFMNCPDAAAMQWLAGWRLPWIAAAKPNARVDYAGEPHALSTLADTLTPASRIQLRHRGQPVSLALASLPVTARHASVGEPDGAMTLWMGELSNTDNGGRLGRKYWLASAHDREEADLAGELIECQLLLSELPALTRRAWQRVAEAGVGQADPALRLRIASAMATVALRLDHESGDWGMDVRAQLLGLLGGQRSRHAHHLLDALLHLFVAHDGFRALGESLSGAGEGQGAA